MKLKYKLSILIFSLILLTAGVNYFLLTSAFESLQIKRLESAEVLLGQSLAQKMYRDVIEGNTETVVALLFKEKILREKKLSYLVVFDRANNFFAHTYLTAVPTEIIKLNNSFEKTSKFRIDNFLDTPIGVYNIAIPIMEGIIQVGTLHIGIDKDFIAETASPLTKASTLTLFFAFFLIIVGGGLALAASSAITQSLTRLETVARRLSHGDFDIEIDATGKDEVARLAQTFVTMRDSIQEAQEKLEKQNENLETIVSKRTAQLETNNRKLEESYQKMQLLNEDLNEQRKNLKIVFSAMTYPLYVVNLDYTIAMMNDVAEQMMITNDSTSLTCYSISHHSAHPCNSNDHPCTLQKILESKGPVVLDHQHYDNDGNPYPVEVHGYPIFDDKGEIIQIVESFIDVSEKRRAEEEKLRLEQELSRAQKLESIGTLAAGVAHEINTPIQFIGDNTRFTSEAIADLIAAIAQYEKAIIELHQEKEDLIQEIREKFDLDYLEEELPSALKQTLEGTNHVADIVKAMKDFSHFGSEEDLQYQDINQAIQSTVTISKNEWKYVADLEVDLDQELDTVKCHIGEIKQVLLNLIVNSAHAIEALQNKTGKTDKGHILIATKDEEDAIVISVKDSGTGIPEIHQSKIFDPFYTTKEVGQGSGQGLSVAYQIIKEKHRGKIWFETEEGKGSTFMIRLNKG